MLSAFTYTSPRWFSEGTTVHVYGIFFVRSISRPTVQIYRIGFYREQLLLLLFTFSASPHLFLSSFLAAIRLLLQTWANKYIMASNSPFPSHPSRKKRKQRRCLSASSSTPLPPVLLPQCPAAARAAASAHASPSPPSLSTCQRTGWARTRTPPCLARGRP